MITMPDDKVPDTILDGNVLLMIAFVEGAVGVEVADRLFSRLRGELEFESVDTVLDYIKMVAMGKSFHFRPAAI